MAKQIPDLTQLLPADLTADDLLVVRDVSANKDKKIRVGDVTGMPAIGWIAALETWTFASYANGVGVVNIPSGGLTKYAVGNRVQFSQTTGGKKYAIVTGVTNTTLTLALLSGATLANEGIATPQYSTEYAPPTSDNVDWTTFLKVLLQSNVSNSQRSGLKVQYGWGYCTSPGEATYSNTKAITFPEPFSSPPIVICAGAGYIDGSNPTAITDLATWEKSSASAGSVSSTGFITRAFGGGDVISSNRRIGFSWIAIGV